MSILKLKVLGSGSKGNCYLLQGEGETLILEAGIPVKEIKKALDFNFKPVKGCLITHSHNDHSKSVKDLMAIGVKTYAPEDVFISKGLQGKPYGIEVSDYQDIRIGGFNVKVLPAKHDVPIVSYLIEYKGITTVFITDSYYLPYQLKNVSNWLIEANYDRELLTGNVDKGYTNSFLAARVIKSHLSIDKALEAIEQNRETLKNVVLIHLSDSNSDEEGFKTKLQKRIGKPVYIALPGLEVNL